MSYFSSRIPSLCLDAIESENFYRKNDMAAVVSTELMHERVTNAWLEIVNYVRVINGPAQENIKLKALRWLVVKTERLLANQIHINLREGLPSQEIQIRVQNSINVINAWISGK